MQTITFLNPKGGSGKTTAAFLLAEQIAIAGGRVTVLDTDPNENILNWYKIRKENGKNLPFDVLPRPTNKDIIYTINDLEEVVDYLIVDLEGSKDKIATNALIRTDLAVIPLDGSAMEARQAAEAVGIVHATSTAIRSKIDYSLLFTRTNAAFQTTDEREVRGEMEEAEVSFLPVRLAKRAPYTRIFRDTILLSELPNLVASEMKGRGVSAVEKAQIQINKAISNAQDYSQAVIDRLSLETTK